MKNIKKNVVVAWNGLPAYAAHLIREGQILCGFDFPVLGTQPDVPIKGMESILGNSLKWIEPDMVHKWSKLEMKTPDVFVHSGWKYKHFNSLADEVRKKGGTVVGMFDNCWKGNLRQLLGSLYFRLFLKKKYSAAWVPGRSAHRLVRYIGFREEQIYKGIYGADRRTFRCINPINDRPKQMLFVGRLTDRKGVLELTEAFSRCIKRFPDWKLNIVGNGELLKKIKTGKNIVCSPFMQPYQIADLMNESKVFALASREEHWGLVVHEAALCGCALLLQSGIGAVPDLANEQNAELFKKTSITAIEAAMLKIMRWEKEKYELASIYSLKAAESFGPSSWANQLVSILESV